MRGCGVATGRRHAPRSALLVHPSGFGSPGPRFKFGQPHAASSAAPGGSLPVAPVRVAAVVTSHDRREFLPFAVRSALDGGADEVIVVRNFKGPIEGCEGRYRDVPCDVPDTNEKEARGLEASSAEVVGFLDDDDLWAPQKVPRLREVFGTDPDLVYF